MVSFYLQVWESNWDIAKTSVEWTKKSQTSSIIGCIVLLYPHSSSVYALSDFSLNGHRFKKFSDIAFTKSILIICSLNHQISGETQIQLERNVHMMDDERAGMDAK